MDVNMKLLISSLTDSLVSNPAIAIEIWTENKLIDETLRMEVLTAIGDADTFKERLYEVIEILETSPNADTQTTGKILRWSAKNYE